MEIPSTCDIHHITDIDKAEFARTQLAIDEILCHCRENSHEQIGDRSAPLISHLLNQDFDSSVTCTHTNYPGKDNAPITNS